MNSKQKIAAVRTMVTEEAAINPSGRFSLELASWLDLEATGGIPDEAPIVFYWKEQWTILKKFEEEGFIHNVEWLDEKRHLVALEIVKKANGQDTPTMGDVALDITETKSRKSVYSELMTTVDELLKNIDLRNKSLLVLGWNSSSNLARGKTYKVGINEENDEIVLLMEELGLLEADWEGLRTQTHEPIGHRTIEVLFEADTVLDLLDRINGKKAIVKNQTIEFISRHLGDLSSGTQLITLLQSWGVPPSLIEYPNTKWRMIESVLTFYASSPNREDTLMFFTLVEEIAHPLMYGGDKERALEVQDNFSNYLQYNGYCFSNGKIVRATSELIEASDDRQKERRNRPVDEGLQNLVSNFFTHPQNAIPIRIVGETEVKINREKTVTNHQPKNVSAADLRPQITAGDLIAYSDGSIKFGSDDLEMRNQLKDLCRLFMNRVDVLTPIDRIRDEIIRADKRKTTSFTTISKYVSELHGVLQIHFGKQVIFNQKEEGWYFRLPK